MGAAGGASAAARPDVLLVTLDTVRTDALFARGSASTTPNLDALAARGVRFASAWAPAPLTLPAHASLLTGRDPGEHGVRDNGLAPLAPGIPTLAEAFARAGYRTAAVVGSRILDRRFGLARGFAAYDDRMTAERTGEFGYPERDAAAVVAAARAWLAGAGAGDGAPRFLWVHFYDPHAPYAPAGLPADAPERARYDGEIAAVDRATGELLAALPGRERWLVAFAGDHGEAFGEHGEREHGLLLYRPTLEVPLAIAGPGVAGGRVIATPVATRRLAATLLDLAGVHDRSIPGPPLPLAREEEPAPIVSETFYPASVYGWSPLVAVTRGTLRLVLGPRARLYDLASDPGETRDLAAGRREAARPLVAVARKYRDAHPFAAGPPPDSATRQLLSSLGYLSGATGRPGELDPVEGADLVARFDRARALQESGDPGAALALVRDLVARSPGSVPFLARAAALERIAGDPARAEPLLRRALSIQPSSEFLHASLGENLLAAGRREEGEKELEAALALDPRMAAAWLALAEEAARSGRPEQERAILERAAAAGTGSGAIEARRAQIAEARGDLDAAERSAAEAVRLLPEWPVAWLVAGEVAEKRGDSGTARERYERAAALGGPAADQARRRLARLP